MKIGIIGAGFTGLSAANNLTKLHEVTLFEKEQLPGGLALGYQEKNWEWSLEQHYHHLFTNDQNILNLASQINYDVIVRRPKTSVFVENEIFQLDSVSSVLGFPKLSIVEKMRMSAVLAGLKLNPFWKYLETYKADKTLPSLMGQKPYRLLWEPLLNNKFGQYKDEVSLAWFWARIYKRTQSLAYPEKGFLYFAKAIADHIKKNNGTIYYETIIEQIREKNNQVFVKTKKNNKEIEHVFDRVIVTLPSRFFMQITPQLPTSYKEKMYKLKGLGAINLVLRLKKPFFSDNTYWLSVCDRTSPIMAIVEHTNFMDKKFYDNEHIVYVGNYLMPDHKYFSYSVTELLKAYDDSLVKHNPSYKKNLIGATVFKAPFAQPVIPTNYSRMLPSFQTPLQGVLLANIEQVYPWDRGTNYAVELGEKIANLVNAAS